jgi:predicted deacetylase
MIDQKLSIITIHDVNPSPSEKILKTLDELNKLKVNYNLSIVPYYNKKYNLKDYTDFSDRISSTLQADNNNNVELSLH